MMKKFVLFIFVVLVILINNLVLVGEYGVKCFYIVSSKMKGCIVIVFIIENSLILNFRFDKY